MSDELREDAFLEDSMERYGDAVYRLALCRLGSRSAASAPARMRRTFIRMFFCVCCATRRRFATVNISRHGCCA